MSLSIQDCAAQFEAYEQANLGAHTAGARDRAQAYRHAADFLRENAVLQWTKEPPTREGFYWHRVAGRVGQPTVRQVYLDFDNCLMLANAGFPIEVAILSGDNEWAGPISPPL